MKSIHTTNYTNAFIEVAEDCKAVAGAVPPEKAVKTIARMQYDRIMRHPYRYTSDDLIFGIHAERSGIGKADLEKGRREFFCKGQACLRSSPLAKTYGWGIHFDSQGRVAIYPVESKEYARFKADKGLKHLKAMRGAK
jgi:hypothetical protein